MADIYVRSGAGGTPDGLVWGTAWLTLAAALPANATDTIYIAADHNESAGAWTLLFPSTMGLRILCVDHTSGALSTGAVVSGGTATTACVINGNAYAYGVSFLGGSGTATAADLNVASFSSSIPATLIFEACQLHCRGNGATAYLSFGPTGSTGNDEMCVKLINTSIGVGHASSSILCNNGKVEGVGITLMGTTGLTNLFLSSAGTKADLNFSGCDLTGVTYVNVVSGAASTLSSKFTFSQCKLDPYSLALSTTSTLLGNAEVFLHDCDTGDTHGTFGYFNALGSVVSDTGIKLTAGAAGQSWKVTANANASHAVPFCTPWFGYHNSTLGAAITPYIEVARDVSSTAYQHDETWMELLCKSTSTSPASTLSTGRMPLLGTPANIDTGVGTGSWSPGSGSPDWSGKLVLGAPAAAATVTPAENGHIMARVCMAVADTVYVDPQIRT